MKVDIPQGMGYTVYRNETFDSQKDGGRRAVRIIKCQDTIKGEKFCVSLRLQV